MSNNTTHSVTDFDTLEQLDDFGCIYGAFTLQSEHWDNFDDFAHVVQLPDVTTWYENIVTGWSFGTPDKYTTEVYTIGELPDDFDSFDTDEMDDSQRVELAQRVYECVNNPHSDALAARAGLVHLGSFDTDQRADHSYVVYLASIASFLDSIDYEDVISF